MRSWRTSSRGNKDNHEQKSNVQCQAQTLETNQAQATAEKQTLIQAVDDTFESVIMAAQMAQNPTFDEHVVNSATDGVMLSLNMMTVCCAEFHKEGKQDALDLAKKRTYDQWEQLKQEDGKTYAMTLKHRDFIVAALNGEKNLRYKERRATEVKLFEQEPHKISQTFGTIIHQGQHFDAEQESYSDPAVNQKLREQQAAALAQYRTSNEYKKAENTAKYQRPSQEQFYFTCSGQKARFVDKNAEQEKKEMDDQVYGVVDAYAAIKGRWNYTNSMCVIKDNEWWPCVILIPNESQSFKIHDRIQVCPAHPRNDRILDVHPDSLEFDVKKIKAIERKHAKEYGKLGYPSIDEQDKQMESMDVDH